MTTKGEAFAGLSVALTTPFRESEVDYQALRAQVEFQIEAGTTCLCPAGTTGECPTGGLRSWPAPARTTPPRPCG
jgi:4-hydroxy-tetrahydrodipicolinate synthase